MMPNPIAEDLFAEVACLRCKGTQWIPFVLRFSGRKSPPIGIESDPKARCGRCPTNCDFTDYTGHKRFKDDAK